MPIKGVAVTGMLREGENMTNEQDITPAPQRTPLEYLTKAVANYGLVGYYAALTAWEADRKRIIELEEELQSLKKEFAVDIIMKEKALALAQEADEEDADLLDEQGYPTEYVLNTIRNWPYQDGWNELMEFVFDVWKYPTHFDVRTVHGSATRYELTTGGWSGNEDIISAMQGNFLFWSLCWEESNRGGKYTFVVNRNYPTT
jgi:hypothetical protein